MCNAPVLVRSVTAPSSEAPEMLQLPFGAWIGIVSGEGSFEVVVTCSEDCMQQLLTED